MNGRIPPAKSTNMLHLYVAVIHFVLHASLSANRLCNQFVGAIVPGAASSSPKTISPLDYSFFVFIGEADGCISYRLTLCPLKAVKIPNAIKNKKWTPLIITGYVSNRIYLSAHLSYNVPGNWRFFVPDKENAKHFTGTKKCGGAKYRRGR